MFDKFWAQKCIFCTVFPCQICMSLHEIYSYALLTKLRSKWLDIGRVFFFFCIFGSEMKSQSNKQVETFCWLEINTRRGCQWFPKVLCSPQRKGHQNNVALLPSTSCFVHFVPVLDGEKPERSCLPSKKGRRNR